VDAIADDPLNIHLLEVISQSGFGGLTAEPSGSLAVSLADRGGELLRVWDRPGPAADFLVVRNPPAATPSLLTGHGLQLEGVFPLLPLAPDNPPSAEEISDELPLQPPPGLFQGELFTPITTVSPDTPGLYAPAFGQDVTMALMYCRVCGGWRKHNWVHP